MSASDDKFYHAQITQRVDFAPDLWMFRMRSGGDFTFVPGQYATLGVEDGGKRVERPYSIVSAPSKNGYSGLLSPFHSKSENALSDLS